MQRDGFIFYKSFFDAGQLLGAEEKLLYYEKIIHYGVLGIEKKTENSFIESLFFLIKPQLDANNSKYKNGKKGAVHGAKGGRPRKPQENPSGVINENPKKTPKEKGKEKVNVKDKENVQKIIDGFSCSQKIKELVIQFFEHRKEIKKEMTPRALIIFLNRIIQLDENVAAAAIERAILNKRQDIYPDKETGYIPQKPPPMKPATREEIERRFY